MSITTILILPVLKYTACTLKRMEGQVLTLVALSGGKIMIIPERSRQLISQQGFVKYLLCVQMCARMQCYRGLRHNC